MPRRLIFIALLLIQLPAHAYIGPGLGAGVIGVILGILGSILLALMAIFWYPVKRMLKRKRKSGEQDPNNAPDNRDNRDDDQ
jgi:hypothetical protein